jgi:hypothetical protein
MVVDISKMSWRRFGAFVRVVFSAHIHIYTQRSESISLCLTCCFEAVPWSFAMLVHRVREDLSFLMTTGNVIH